ncbi:MAG: AAA family ATPase [Halanaerobium sp.]|nr:AAA family ATPase [Halanaerobium sp.]
MKGIEPQQPILLAAYSRVFTGRYQSKIIEVRPEGILIETPVSEGRLVLMGAGTRLKVTVNSGSEGEQFEAELLRRSKDDELMLITRPDLISRGGRRSEEGKGARVVALTSGKGGVGKSTLSLNLALELLKQGNRVTVIDADLGTANLDIMLGLQVRANLSDVIFAKRDIQDIVIEGPEGLLLVPGGSGFQELTELSDWQFTRLINSFNYLDRLSDYILLDTGAGLSRNVTNFLLAADQIIVVTTPEPHCVTDAYAIIKVISELKDDPLRLQLVVNKVENQREGERVGSKMADVTEKFLQLKINYLGSVSDDRAVVRSNKERRPVVLQRPNARAAKDIRNLVKGYLLQDESEEGKRGVVGFLSRFKNLFNNARESMKHNLN